MSTSQSDIIKIVKSHAELGLNEWIGGGLQLSCHAVRLETEDSGGNKINIVPPSSYNWVPFNRN